VVWLVVAAEVVGSVVPGVVLVEADGVVVDVFGVVDVLVVGWVVVG